MSPSSASAHAFELELQEESPLEQRLRSLRWPGPPPGARERGLEALRARFQDQTVPEPAPSGASSLS